MHPENVQLKYGELHAKRDDTYAIAQRLLDKGFAGWKAEIKKIEEPLRAKKYNGGVVYTAFTVPSGKYLDYDKNGNPRPTPESAIASIRYIDNGRNIVCKYDLWKRQRVRFDLNTGKQLIDDYKDEHIFIRELQNEIAGYKRLSFSEQTMKDALSRLTIYN